jgi:hypothetical protein
LPLRASETQLKHTIAAAYNSNIGAGYHEEQDMPLAFPITNQYPTTT